MHIEVAAGVIVDMGNGSTVTVAEVVAEQVLASVTVTLYVVVARGDTVLVSVPVLLLQR
jgi:hypothetical protein